MPDVKTTARAEHEFNVWYGDVEAFARLYRISDEWLAKARADSGAFLEAELKDLDEGSYSFHLVRSQLDERQEWCTTVVLREAEYALEHHGVFQEVVSEADLRSVVHAKLFAPDSYASDYRIVAEFQRERPILSGCRILVQGPEKGWVQGASAALVSEVRKGVPWWSPAATPVGAAIALGALQFVIYVALSVYNYSDSLLLTALTSMVLALLSGTALIKAVGRIIPRFELTRNGIEPRGKRAINWIAAVVVMPIGIGIAVAISFGT